MGLVNAIATLRPKIVRISCGLLKVSERMSNVPLGETRVKNRSRPVARMSEVDSRVVGEECRCLIEATSYTLLIIRRASSGKTGSYWINHSLS